MLSRNFLIRPYQNDLTLFVQAAKIMALPTMKMHLVLFALAVFVFSGCASTSSLHVNAQASARDAYNVAVRTLVKNGFQISHTDRDSGVITGERPVRQAVTNREDGKMIRVTILVEDTNEGSLLTTTWTPPEGALGTFKTEHDEFLRGLSAALPGVQTR